MRKAIGFYEQQIAAVRNRNPHSLMNKPYILAHDTSAPTTIAVCDIGAFEYGPQLYLPLVMGN